VQINVKHPSRGGREIDSSDGTRYIESKSGEQGKNLPKTAYEDNYNNGGKTKSGINRWDGGDTEDLRVICVSLTEEECAHALLTPGHPEFGVGLTEESLDRINNAIRPQGKSGHTDIAKARNEAKTLKDPNKVTPLIFSGEGWSLKVPCWEDPNCRKWAKKVLDRDGPDSMANFIKMIDASGDFTGPSYGLLTSAAFFTMSGEFGFVEDDEEFSSVLWLLPSIVLSAIFSYVYFRKSRPKTPLTSVF
jgi:hypothetical protein